MTKFKPEGHIITSNENKLYLKNLNSLKEAAAKGLILEGRAAVCNCQHDLIVDLGFTRGIIPREEGALGISDGSTGDIALISKVNKPVCFKVTGFKENSDKSVTPILSRRLAQEKCVDEYISLLKSGDIIDAKVTHLEPFGAFVDIGCGIPSLLPLDAVSVSRISHPADRFSVGDDIKVIVKNHENPGRINISHKELLGTWEENAAMFSAGETIAGIVRSVESYGIFIELTPNLAGLAEPAAGVYPGQQAGVYIKSIIPEKMKIKLILVDAFSDETERKPLRYFTDESHMDFWQYSPESCSKNIFTDFSE